MEAVYREAAIRKRSIRGTISEADGVTFGFKATSVNKGTTHRTSTHGQVREIIGVSFWVVLHYRVFSSQGERTQDYGFVPA